ncbi:MAG: CaiB/BaiF CoA transferase family protein [Pseudomonadota bacterium]
MTAQQHVMTGYRVLDFTQVVAGPTATRLLAEMGAEVIKVELAPLGDMTRQLPVLRNGRSSYFLQQNRGKKSLCLDIRKAAARGLLEDLVRRCDVLVENFSAGVIGRLGLSWERVHELNPRLVMCSISGFGQAGPLSAKPGYDAVAAAYAGVLDLIGYPDGYPLFPQLAIGDGTTGVHALAAISTALLYRERSGEGQFLDISLLDSYFHQHDVAVNSYSASAGAFVPRRSGHHHLVLHPLGIYRGRGADEFYMLVVPPLRWPAFCELIERPELAADPRFATNEVRMAHHAELVGVIEAWLRAQPSREVILAKMEEAHFACAPVLSVPEAMRHPHFVERRIVRKVSDPCFGELELPGMPLRFSAFPGELELEAPDLGEHNRTVLGEILNLGDDRIDALEAAGVLHAAARQPPPA